MRRSCLGSALAFVAMALLPPAHAQLGVRAIDVVGERGRGGQPAGGLLNGDFTSGSTRPWTLYSSDGSSWIDVESEELHVHVGFGVPKGRPDIQLLQKNLFLEGDSTYVLRFDAKSTLGSNLRVRILQHDSPFENYGLRINQNIQTRMKTFELIFATTPGDKRDARLSFLLTEFAQPGEVYTFDNISLEKFEECGDGQVTGAESCDSGAGPVVADGGFEAGTPNPAWHEVSTNFGSPLCGPGSCGFDLALEGAWWAWFGGIPLLEEGILSQSITLPAASTATLNFWLWAITCSGEASDFFEVTVDGVPIFGFDLTDPRCNGPFYEPVALDLTPYAGTTFDLALRAITGTAGSTANIFVDAVSVDIDDCRADCTFCGDGATNGYETCDDGNFNDGDGCTSECVSGAPAVFETLRFSREELHR